MDDATHYAVKTGVADMPRHIRNAVAMNGGVTMEMPAVEALQVARAIENGIAPVRVAIVYRDAPLSRFEVFLHTLTLGLCMFGFVGDAALGLIDLIRMVLP